jgi:glycosyltransferase involved in cell wall biosynthesis
MCQGLSRRAWQVTLVAPNAPSQVAGGIPIVGVRVPSGRFLRALLGGYRTIRAARAIEADVYHLHDPELLIWKWLLERPGRVVIYDMHEYVAGAITTRPWIPDGLRRALALCWKLLERIVLRSSPVVLAENSYAAHYPWLKRKAIVLNLPDTDALFAMNTKHASDTAVYVGRVSATRGSLRMIEALRLLQERGINLGLHVVGPIAETHRQELVATIERGNVRGVLLHGYQQPLAAWQVAASSIAGLAILEPEPNYINSFPTKMFEYMALGLPVVVSNFPLYRQIVEGAGCGICVDPLDAGAIADSLERLVRDPQLRRDMGQRGQDAVRNEYRWDRQLDRLEAFYYANLSTARGSS